MLLRLVWSPQPRADVSSAALLPRSDHGGISLTGHFQFGGLASSFALSQRTVGSAHGSPPLSGGLGSTLQILFNLPSGCVSTQNSAVSHTESSDHSVSRFVNRYASSCLSVVSDRLSGGFAQYPLRRVAQSLIEAPHPVIDHPLLGLGGPAIVVSKKAAVHQDVFILSYAPTLIKGIPCRVPALDSPTLKPANAPCVHLPSLVGGGIAVDEVPVQACQRR